MPQFQPQAGIECALPVSHASFLTFDEGKVMCIPNHLTYFFRAGQTPFEVLCDLDEVAAEEILKRDVLWRGDGTYLRYRKEHEQYLRNRFIEKGGEPSRKYPVYMILGDSPSGPHNLDEEYDHALVIPLSVFKPEDISFTYPDSLYKVPLDDLGRLHLDRDLAPTVYRIEELENLIQRYRVYEFNNHYVEAQVWVDEPLEQFNPMKSSNKRLHQTPDTAGDP